MCRSQWPRGLRRGSAAARLLGLWVRIPQRAWMSVCCECCVLLGRGLCNGLVTRPEESYRVWCVWVWSWSLVKWGGLGPLGAVESLEKKVIQCNINYLSTMHVMNGIKGIKTSVKFEWTAVVLQTQLQTRDLRLSQRCWWTLQCVSYAVKLECSS
jgi:hypothetical protein